MNDPLLSSNPDEREQYKSGVLDLMRQTIDEDRAGREAQRKQRDEQQATIIGGVGVAGGLNQAIR